MKMGRLMNPYLFRYKKTETTIVTEIVYFHTEFFQ